jgi:hypothetical protein
MSITNTSVKNLDELISYDIENININEGAVKTLDCLNNMCFNEIIVTNSFVDDDEYTSIYSHKMIISGNLYRHITFINCVINELDVSNNILLNSLKFVKCVINKLIANNCNLVEIIDIPQCVKYLDVENNLLRSLQIYNHNFDYINIKKNNKLIINPNIIHTSQLFYDSDEEIKDDVSKDDSSYDFSNFDYNYLNYNANINNLRDYDADETDDDINNDVIINKTYDSYEKIIFDYTEII